MALKQCRECGKQISSDAKTCPSCGKRNPHGQLSTGAGCLMLLLFFVVVGMCAEAELSEIDSISQARTNESTSVANVPYKVLERWAIPNGGYGELIVVDSSLVTPSIGRALGETIQRRTAGQRNAFVYVFRTERAARLWRKILANPEMVSPHYDRNFIGSYTRNGNTGFHRFDWFPSGINGTTTEYSF